MDDFVKFSTMIAAICVVVISISRVPVISAQFLFATNYGLAYNKYARLCAPVIECDPNAVYRSFDGSCNNLITPWLGASKTPHLRILDAYYNDGEYEFRKQTDGTPLPNPRDVNLQVFLYKQSQDWNDHNVLFMQWGQLIAHDVTHLPPDTSIGTDCCKLQNENPVPVQCRAIIDVPKNDPVYWKRGETCINFNRAETSFTYGCPLTPATFMVLSNHFIDASQIYGTDEEQAASLRTFSDGRLKSDFYEGRQEFCPQRNRTTWKCDTSPKSAICFQTGDVRVNQNLGIALFQNLFLRFHNVIAYRLRRLNPFWNDEILYQETRRFVIAVVQHVTYTHYLPILLGEKFTALNGFFDDTVYDENVNPSTAIEFSTGAFRVLHNQIPPVLSFVDGNGFDFNRVLLTDWMDKPELLTRPHHFDGLLRGFQETPTRAEQPSFNPLIANFLFLQTAPKFVGSDLMTTDMQRGRDTGMPPYNKMRPVCGIREAGDFDDLIDLIAYENVQKLKELYSSVDDIDFVVGALLEIPAEGAKVGPTARCIIADSFYRYRVGDRFFYDVQGQPGSFTPAQLQTLKTVSFGQVICATSNLQYLPEDVFMPLNDRFNTRKYSCEDLALNLNAWKYEEL